MVDCYSCFINFPTYDSEKCKEFIETILIEYGFDPKDFHVRIYAGILSKGYHGYIIDFFTDPVIVLAKLRFNDLGKQHDALLVAESLLTRSLSVTK